MEQKKSKIPKVVKIILIFLFLIIVISALSSNDDSSSSNNKKTTNKKKEKFSIIEGTENGYADDYGIAYYVEGTIKNNTDKKYSYVQVTYNVYDSENNNLGTCMANNNNLNGNETWKFKALCSGDAKSITSYKLEEIKGW